jgi:chromosome segregation ATPase
VATLVLVSAISAIIPTVRLDQTRHRLAHTRRDLHNTSEILAATRRELSAQEKSATKLQADLEAAKASLRDSQHSADLQGSQLATIKRCLNDVQDFQDATANGNQAAASTAATAADRDCAEAQAFF